MSSVSYPESSVLKEYSVEVQKSIVEAYDKLGKNEADVKILAGFCEDVAKRFHILPLFQGSVQFKKLVAICHKMESSSGKIQTKDELSGRVQKFAVEQLNIASQKEVARLLIATFIATGQVRFHLEINATDGEEIDAEDVQIEGCGLS